jgi:hypothetical protein
MATADHLKQAAISIFGQMRDRKTKLQAEYDEVQSKLAYMKAELDTQVDIVSRAYERMLNFKPSFEGKNLCPRCWVVNSKESALSPIGQGHLLRCNVCQQEFSVV